MPIQTSSTLTPREYETMNYEKEMWEKQAAHAIEIKKLDIEASKLEAKITAWFKIPLAILRLPLYILFVIPLSIYAITKQPIPEEYWHLLK